MHHEDSHNVSRETFHVQHDINAKIGKMGEDISVRYLIGKGHTVISRNSKHLYLELDVTTTFHGKRYLYEVKTVAREMITNEDISREMFAGASRYSNKKHANTSLGAKIVRADAVKVLWVGLSLRDSKSYVCEFEVQ
jgi:Holliday junction resolvase-like predicted endonuclease